MGPVDDDLDRRLDARLDRALAALPTPRAPRALLPRLLAIVERPWYGRAWLTWPRGWQAVSVAVALAGIWLLVAVPDVAPAADPAGFGSVTPLARIVWRQVIENAAVPLFGIAVAGTLAGAASWTALTRLALGGRPL